MPKRYTEAELMEFENCRDYYQAAYAVRELTNYIRHVVGTVEIPQFHPLPTAVERSIIRHRRKLISERVPASELRRIRAIEREQTKWRGHPRYRPQWTENRNADSASA